MTVQVPELHNIETIGKNNLWRREGGREGGREREEGERERGREEGGREGRREGGWEGGEAVVLRISSAPSQLNSTLPLPHTLTLSHSCSPGLRFRRCSASSAVT